MNTPVLSPIPESIIKICTEIHEVGSRVTCDPPVMDSDHDFLCLTNDWRNLLIVSKHEGFAVGGSVPIDKLERRTDATEFTSLRRESVNLIVTDSPDFASRFMAATSVAKRLNLQEKSDRIALFQAVLYGNASE